MYTISVGNAFGHSIYSDLAVQEITEGVNAAFENIDRIFAEYHQSLLYPENMEAELFGEAKKEAPVPQQAPQQPTQSKGIAATLGAAIRTLIGAFGQMIQRIGEMFMGSDARLRKQQEELQRQLAANPDLKRKVMSLSAEGAIDLKDMKDINQLSAEVDKLMEEKDPQTLKGKLAKLKKEWDDPNGKFLKTVTAVGAVATLVTTLYKGSQALHNFGSDAKDRSKKSQENVQGLYNFLNNHKDDKGNKTVDIETVNDVEAKLAARKFEQGCYQEALSIAQHNSSELSKGYGIVMKIFGNKKGKDGKYKTFGGKDKNGKDKSKSFLQRVGANADLAAELKPKNKPNGNKPDANDN